MVRVDGSQGQLGTTVSFERSLGLSDSEARPILNAWWRITKRQRLEAFYFDLNRSGSSISQVNIRFGGTEFQANLPIQAFFDVEILSVGYSFSPIFDAKKEWTLGLAASFQDIKVGITGTEASANDPIVQEEASVLAPLPTLTTRFDYALTDKWILTLHAGYFTIELGDGEFDGSVLSVLAGVRYKVFKHLSVSLNYDWFRVQVDVEGDKWNGDLDYKYRGPMFTVSTFF